MDGLADKNSSQKSVVQYEVIRSTITAARGRKAVRKMKPASTYFLLLLPTLYPSCVAAFTPSHRGSSRFFLDTADTEEWDALLPTGIFHGVTTNPTLLKRAGEPCTIENLHRLANKALSLSDEFMCQAWGEDLFACGMELSAPARDRITVKVPVTIKGVQAASELIQAGCRVCLTACYNHKQALLAASVGAEYLAPYLGRMTDTGLDGQGECCYMDKIVKGMGSSTRILVASIRDAETLAELASDCGMDTYTFAPAIARQLFVDPLTDKAAIAFEEDAK
eukprot:scaffold10861_cov180-Amphora_coffeaeformis.AAC.25